MPKIELVTGDDIGEWRKSIGSAQKKGWERAAAVRQSAAPRNPTTVVHGNSAAMQVEQPTPRSPKEVYEMSRRHFMQHFKRSREDFRVMVDGLRKTNPSLISHLTDEQAAELLEKEWDRKIRESLNRVYPKIGRGNELTIKTSGW